MWREPTFIQTPDALRQAVGGHPLVAEILARRGILTPQAAGAFLDPARYAPAPPSALPDLSIAAQRLKEAIARGQRIGVWGDFDVDGQTATAVLVSALQELSADVVYYIPHRLTESHGIKQAALEAFLAKGVQIVLTCDTGIAEHDAIAYANAQGASVLVTDHHDLPERLPPADALVNPRRLPPEHPLYDLPGVGVVYKLAQALYAPGGGEQASQCHLDLVALGIVADVAEQKADTRYLLQCGLARLRRAERAGLQALFETANIDPARLSAEHIGFGVGPRLNALGRLGDANLAVELLTTRNTSRARILAAQLEGLNNQRKLLSEQIYAAAQDHIARDPSLLDASALVLAHPQWHGGVIGPVAGRLAEQYERPVILIVIGQDGIGRGSARSAPGCDIHAALKRADQHLIGYGGHPGAAGLSLQAELIPAFRRALSRAVDAVWDRTAASEGTQIDAYVSLGDLSLDLAVELERLAPFGQGNPPIRLATRDLSVASHRAFGRNGEHREMTVQDGTGVTCKLVWWRGAEQELPGGRFDLAFSIKSTDYLGRPALTIEWSEARLLEAPVIEKAAPKREVVDWRRELDLRARVMALAAQGDVQVWVEGQAAAQLPGQRRHELAAASTLVVWNAPPGPAELQAALARVSPQRIVVCAVPENDDALEPFVRRLAGLLKYDLAQRQGQVHLPALAAAAGQRLATVRKGIEWLAARGQITIEAWEGDSMRVTATSNQQPEIRNQKSEISDTELESDLRTLLAETAAYRAYFRRADAMHIVQ